MRVNLIAVALVLFIQSGLNVKCQEGSGEPLFLTPYIRSGQIVEAKRLALVGKSVSETIVSYSGFITVNETLGSNLFFWFFPAVTDYENAPVIQWIEGATGLTGLFSIFNDNGPFAVDKNGTLSHKDKPWCLTHSVIYLDNPVGSGFSFTESIDGYPKSGFEAVPDLYEFLTQFFLMFPELQKNDFHVAGISYGGGVYAPRLAHYIHEQNQGNPEVKINLKGLLMVAPSADHETQTEWGEALYSFGLIDQTQRAEFKAKSDLVIQYMQEGAIKWPEIKELQTELFYGSESMFLKATGFEIGGYYNILIDYNSAEYEYFLKFVETNITRRALHVGNVTFDLQNQITSDQLKINDRIFTRPYVEEMLSWGLYKMCFYHGQLDIVVYASGVDKFVRSLKWDGQDEFLNTPRTIWKVDGRVAGYVRTARNLTHVLMRNGGHDLNSENPDWAFDFINRFTRNVPF